MPGVKGRSGGRNRKPAAIKRLQNNPGRRAIPPEIALPGQPVPPPYLRRQRRASSIWRELVPQLTAAGLASGPDSHALALLCTLLARFERGELPLAGLVHVRGLMHGFGLAGPASRSGLSVRPPASAPIPADEALLRARGLHLPDDGSEYFDMRKAVRLS